jgi:acyl-Coa thioesterase superfamily protein/acyl-CoA thioesterase superfamily protein
LASEDGDVTHEFDRATESTLISEGTFAAEIEDGWDINGNANGGYLLALAVRAMRDASGRPDPISVTAHYLAPGKPGPVTIETATVKAGRQLATMTGSMHSGEREILRVLGAFGDVGAMSAGFSNVVGAPPDLPPVDQCVVRDQNSGIVNIGLMRHVRVHIRPEHAGFADGVKSGRALIEGWFEFADGRPIDAVALMLVVDSFPPPVFNIDIPVGWVPTVELTAHVRGIPAPGPLRCRFHSEFVQNGFLQEDSEVWDSSGMLVAQSRQLALLPKG